MYRDFLAVGCNSNLTKEMCNNLSNYLKTKFARFLLSIVKNSQHGTKSTYSFVPVVDFSQSWDDEKLYKHFNLTKDEIDLIEKSSVAILLCNFFEQFDSVFIKMDVSDIKVDKTLCLQDFEKA